VTVHGGLLRLETPGHGHIVDITAGVASVLATAGVDRGVVTVFATGSTVAVTTMEYEPGGVHDLQALLDRLIPAARSTSTTAATTTRTPTPISAPPSSAPRSRSRSSTAAWPWGPGSRWS
jgi:thiamine phosphate synthase YjbQ (UPF0047 family)